MADDKIRQVRFTPELADRIANELAEGESLRRICMADDMPDRTTVTRWMLADPDFAAKCARARVLQAEFHHDQMDEIERDTLRGDLEPAAANVVLSNKRWRMSKLAPKVYGDKLDLVHGGEVKISRVSFADNHDPEH